MYMRPMRLWSMVVNQDQRPLYSGIIEVADFAVRGHNGCCSFTLFRLRHEVLMYATSAHFLISEVPL